ncbi:MAG: tRNA-queuosine alpha-mannosyltransferase domain-containing protein, partial [Spirochaetota bacterium]
MELLFLESFYGGSHRDVADSIAASSRHDVELMTLPARFWKWRMRGAALSFVRQVRDFSDYDLVVCTGLMSVADLRALAGDRFPPDRFPPDRFPPILVYAHETQLAYPAPSEREADLHFAFTDLTNMLAADCVAFNSHTHRNAYLEALPAFLRRLPEYRPMWAVDEIERKSIVCYPGVRAAWETHASAPEPARAEPPLVLWNHRWEFDKQPQAFFAAVREVKRRGIAFRLAVLGESFQVVPKEFVAARDEFAPEIVAFGYLPDRDEYELWLRGADVVVSTAIQENFGIAVVEAIACGAYPLLPRRLSYPEIVPPDHHACLYDDHDDLVRKLCTLLAERERPAAPESLVRHARSFAWDERIMEFDAL